MEKEKQIKKYQKPILMIAYFYRPDGDLDCCNFVAEAGNTTQKTMKRQFLDYANKWNDWGIKKEDIDGIYLVKEEEDLKGRKYQIILSTEIYDNQKIK